MATNQRVRQISFSAILYDRLRSKEQIIVAIHQPQVVTNDYVILTLPWPFPLLRYSAGLAEVYALYLCTPIPRRCLYLAPRCESKLSRSDSLRGCDAYTTHARNPTRGPSLLVIISCVFSQISQPHTFCR